MENRQRLLLRSNLGGTLDGLTNEQIMAIETTMTQFAVSEISRYQNREIKGTITSFFQLCMNFSWDNTILYLRYLSLLMATKKAKMLHKIEKRKVYAIRDSLIGYKILTSRDIDAKKKFKIMKKEVDFRKLDSMADFKIQ